MMTIQQLQAALASDEFSEADKCAIKWQYDRYGDFYKKLFAAIGHADHRNTLRLALGFPDEVQGYLNWTQGDLYERLKRFTDGDTA